MLNFKEKIKEEVFMSTPHNQANKGDIAKTVLMPGDPLRAKYLAETYLENVKQFNATRNMFGYTERIKEKKFPLWVRVWECLVLGFIVMNYFIFMM